MPPAGQHPPVMNTPRPAGDKVDAEVGWGQVGGQTSVSCGLGEGRGGAYIDKDEAAALSSYD